VCIALRKSDFEYFLISWSSSLARSVILTNHLLVSATTTPTSSSHVASPTQSSADLHATSINNGRWPAVCSTGSSQALESDQDHGSPPDAGQIPEFPESTFPSIFESDWELRNLYASDQEPGPTSTFEEGDEQFFSRNSDQNTSPLPTWESAALALWLAEGLEDHQRKKRLRSSSWKSYSPTNEPEVPNGARRNPADICRSTSNDTNLKLLDLLNQEFVAIESDLGDDEISDDESDDLPDGKGSLLSQTKRILRRKLQTRTLVAERRRELTEVRLEIICADEGLMKVFREKRI
jgi:hypothetical protein